MFSIHSLPSVIKTAIVLFFSFVTGTCVWGENQVFQGTFTEQITSTDDTNLYSVGQIFTGYYQYVSSQIDGTFGAQTSAYTNQTSWTNVTLDGSVFLLFSEKTSWTNDGMTVEYDYGPGTQQVGLTETPNGGELTIQNGQVQKFDWSYDQGGFFFVITVGTNGFGNFAAFSFYDTPGSLTTSGTIQFSDPMPVPEPNPTTLWMVGLGCLAAKSRGGFCRLRRWSKPV